MAEATKASPAKQIIFVLMPQFSMMAFSSAIEPLRAANRVAGREGYRWKVFSADGNPVRASNGLIVHPEGSLVQPEPCDKLVICAGVRPEDSASTETINQLRKWRRHARLIGGVCTGSYLLARARLLDDYRCTIHWEDLASFTENFPRLTISSRLFEIDRDRFTCSGGIAPLDMMIDFIARDFGRGLAARVSDLLLHPEAREATAPQRLAVIERTGVHHPKLIAMIEQMEAHIEDPLPLDELAAIADLSARQTERLFKTYFGVTPNRYYRDLRLTRARHLLRHTALPIVQVSLATGFGSAAHFSKCYRESFGHTPRSERASTLMASEA